MGSIEKRQALRIPCDLPVRLTARDGTACSGLIHDISRSGIRVRIPAGQLHADGDNLLAIAERVRQLLGPRFACDLHYEMLGTLVRKHVRLVRIGQHAPEPIAELGCAFVKPLADEETAMLGLGLPALGVTTPDAYRIMPGPRHRIDEGRGAVEPARPRPYDAYLHPTEGLKAEPLTGETSGMSNFEAVVRTRLAPSFRTWNVATVTAALARIYGPDPTLEILDGVRMVWSGKSRIRQVETDPAHGVRLHLEGRE